MSNAFRELLKKIGSGTHTSKDLTRQEAEAAARMMLLQEATPAQIGAFLIAHRIKRPTAAELAGMLDAYDTLGPQFKLDNLPSETPLAVLGNPYDGRSRTAPITPITALILAAGGVPTLLHGGDRMPTKYGIPLVEIWQGLGVDFSQLSLEKAQELLEKTGLSFIYLPKHFPLACNLIPYRDQIGKRPPLATLELIWSPWQKNVHIVSGFVHPPTEKIISETFALRDINNFTMVKGLEGSCDLPRSRKNIIGFGKLDAETSFERFLLPPQDYGFAGKDTSLPSKIELIEQLQNVLQGKSSELMPAAIYNGGFYLWRLGVCADLEAGFAQAEAMLTQGKVAAKLSQIATLLGSDCNLTLKQ